MYSTVASYNDTDELGSIVAHNISIPVKERDALYVVIPVTIIYSFIFVTGVIGNVVTCIVIARNKYMHTATNYYLFSLAISDLLLLVTGLPQEMVSIWCPYPYMFGEAFCVLRGLAAETSGNATILTITAFTVERYIAICYPFLSHTMSKLSRAVKLIVAIWIVSLACAAPYAAQVGVVQLTSRKDSAMCIMQWEPFHHSFEISTFLFFVVPMTIITVLYALIGLKLRNASVMKREGGSFCKTHEERHSHSRKHHLTSQSSGRVINMLAAVVAAFFICWAPFHAQRLVAIYIHKDYSQQDREFFEQIYGIVTYISGTFYYLSATINPILYNIMSLKFREAFKETMARCCGLSPLKSTRRDRSYSVLSRSQHHRSSLIGQSQSTDNSNNSIREDSYASHLLRETAPYLSRQNNNQSKTSESDDGTNFSSGATAESRRTPTNTTSKKTNKIRKGTSQKEVNSGIKRRVSVTLRLKSSSSHLRKRRLHDMSVWSILRCVPSRRHKQLRGRYYIEAASPYEMTFYGQPALFRCSLGHPGNSISNSSLKVWDEPALRDELRICMRSVIEEARV